MERKIENLMSYISGIHNRENGSMLYKKYIDDIKSITPKDVMFIQNEQLKNGLTPSEILASVDKLMNVFHQSLSSHQLAEPITIPFLYYLNEENKELCAILDDFKSVMKTESLSQNNKLKTFMDKVLEYKEHLLKLENILFPYLEKRDERFNGLQILWALHDETRSMIKDIEAEAKNTGNENELKKKVSYLYFNLFGAIQKQNLILFPSAAEYLTEKQFDDMHMQSFDYGFPYITAPKRPKKSANKTDALAGMFVSDTGQIPLDDLSILLDTLPFDITFVDANDELAYFSNPKKRFFPRSKAAIGRNVRNCHPPKSVHIVEKILASFKDGTKDVAAFWINIKGMMVLIKYIALRDAHGTYHGTLEVVQEIDDIRALEGERRLLDWK